MLRSRGDSPPAVKIHPTHWEALTESVCGKCLCYCTSGGPEAHSDSGDSWMPWGSACL